MGTATDALKSAQEALTMASTYVAGEGTDEQLEQVESALRQIEEALSTTASA